MKTRLACALCHRQARIGYRRSHSNIQTKRWQKINLKKMTHQGKKVLVCTQCIKTLSKIK